MDDSNEVEHSIPDQDDYEAIMASCLDYIDGWYTADVDRMARCLHPELVKRTVIRKPERGKWELWRPSTAEMLVGYTKEGGGTRVPAADRRYQITIQDVFRHVATAKCISPLYVDYVQLAKIDDHGWLIVNVLWELREGVVEDE
jgi:hypothetical protein